MVETLRQQKWELSTSEYAKKWTEKSPNSKLEQINNILSNPKLKDIKEIWTLKTKIAKREYRDLQKMLWISYNRCDWKLWKESLDYLNNYVNKLIQEKNTTNWTNSVLWRLRNNVSWWIDGVTWNNWNWKKSWKYENLTDTINIQHNEAQYLATHETMSLSEYNKLFSWKERLQQWQLGDCYLVSWIHELARAQHFDTLMRTSIQRVNWKDGSGWWYQIKIPLWEPSWRKILLKDSEVNVAKIRWNKWYKLLELAYAKNKLRKNDRNGNKYRPITSSELKKISWWWTHEVLQTFLGKNNIWFSDFWTMSNYKKGKTLAQSSQTAKNEIHNFLKNYVPSIWNKFVSLASLPWSSDRNSYTVWWKTIYRRHAYSLTWVKKDGKWNIKSITVLNPWNKWWQWKNYQDFTLDEFYKSFSAMSCGKVKTKTFLDNKSA